IHRRAGEVDFFEASFVQIVDQFSIVARRLELYLRISSNCSEVGGLEQIGDVDVLEWLKGERRRSDLFTHIREVIGFWLFPEEHGGFPSSKIRVAEAISPQIHPVNVEADRQLGPA